MEAEAGRGRLRGLPILALLALPVLAAAEPPLAQGSRLRLRIEGEKGWVEGALGEVEGTHLRVLTGAGWRRLERDKVQRLDTSLGRHRNWKRGLLVGVALWAAACIPEEGRGDSWGDCMAWGGPIFGFSTGVGALVKTERWRQVPPDRWPAAPAATDRR